MIREYFLYLKKLELAGDIVIAIAVFFMSYPYGVWTPVLPGFVAVWIGSLYVSGIYESLRIRKFSDILWIIWSSALIGIGIFGIAALVSKSHGLNRLHVSFMFLAAAGLTSLEKFAVVAFLRQIRKKGYNFRNLLVIGTGRRARRFVDMIRQRSEWGLNIMGLVDEDPSLVGTEINGYKVIGTLKDVPGIVHENVVDEVACIVPHSWFRKIEEIVIFCETEGVRVDIAIDIFDLKFAKARQVELQEFPMLSFERPRMKTWQVLFKELFDMVFSGALIILLSPIFLVTAIAIKMTSPGTVLYRQVRCGLNGRRFALYKFRTMVENADKMQPALEAHNEMLGPAFKMLNDPRVTPLGRFLRKFSIDELPQLWNVLRRDMSIVGPRPPLPEEVKRYDNWQRRRLSMRPGITCLWQVQGRNKIKDFNEWANLDLEYIDHWSLWDDFKILIKTVPAVLFGIGSK